MGTSIFTLLKTLTWCSGRQLFGDCGHMLTLEASAGQLIIDHHDILTPDPVISLQDRQRVDASRADGQDERRWSVDRHDARQIFCPVI